jgi:hypothetical protein
MQKEIFNQIGEIIKNTNASTYTITGYKYLETRLVLHFHDCNQVFDFNIVNSDEGKKLEVTNFFTKDINHEERMEQIGKFTELHIREVADV